MLDITIECVAILSGCFFLFSGAFLLQKIIVLLKIQFLVGYKQKPYKY